MFWQKQSKANDFCLLSEERSMEAELTSCFKSGCLAPSGLGGRRLLPEILCLNLSYQELRCGQQSLKGPLEEGTWLAIQLFTLFPWGLNVLCLFQGAASPPTWSYKYQKAKHSFCISFKTRIFLGRVRTLCTSYTWIPWAGRSLQRVCYPLPVSRCKPGAPICFHERLNFS